MFVRSGREKIDGRDWLVLEYRYPTRRPTSHESVYFTATKNGHVYCRSGRVASTKPVAFAC